MSTMRSLKALKTNPKDEGKLSQGVSGLSISKGDVSNHSIAIDETSVKQRNSKARQKSTYTSSHTAIVAASINGEDFPARNMLATLSMGGDEPIRTPYPAKFLGKNTMLTISRSSSPNYESESENDDLNYSRLLKAMCM